MDCESNVGCGVWDESVEVDIWRGVSGRAVECCAVDVCDCDLLEFVVVLQEKNMCNVSGVDGGSQ